VLVLSDSRAVLDVLEAVWRSKDASLGQPIKDGIAQLVAEGVSTRDCASCPRLSPRTTVALLTMAAMIVWSAVACVRCAGGAGPAAGSGIRVGAARRDRCAVGARR